ncbi:unnamed protein product, partial [Lampetra planeri]
ASFTMDTFLVMALVTTVSFSRDWETEEDVGKRSLGSHVSLPSSSMGPAPGWISLLQAGAGWSRLEQAGASWNILEQADPAWSRLEQRGCLVQA